MVVEQVDDIFLSALWIQFYFVIIETLWLLIHAGI